MAKNTFSRYLWLIGILKENSTGLTLEEIKKLWLESNLNPKGEPLPDRTFLNHVKAIRELFGYSIEYLHIPYYYKNSGAARGTWQIYDVETGRDDLDNLELIRRSYRYTIGKIEKIKIKAFGTEMYFWYYNRGHFEFCEKPILQEEYGIFTIRANSSDADFIRFLLSRGEDIEVLSPQSLIDSLCTQAENILKRYGR